MEKITIYFDNEHTLSVELNSDEVKNVIEWFYGEDSVYKLNTALRTYYIARSHIRHINVSKI